MKQDESVTVSDIQRFCVHDGPGIRTTLFLKGCSLHCPWCANPETIRPEIQIATDTEGNQHTFGKHMTVSDVKSVLLRDSMYYETGGGVTYSGGEPLLQFIMLKQSLHDLHIQGINQCIETSLYAPLESVRIGVEYIDWWYVDCKLLFDKTACYTLIGGNLDLFLANIEYLFLNVERAKITVRFPFVPNMTDCEQNQTALISLIKKFAPAHIEIMKAHNLGKSKYEKLGLTTPQIGDIDNKKLDLLVSRLRSLGVLVDILEI